MLGVLHPTTEVRRADAEAYAERELDARSGSLCDRSYAAAGAFAARALPRGFAEPRTGAAGARRAAGRRQTRAVDRDAQGGRTGVAAGASTFARRDADAVVPR